MMNSKIKFIYQCSTIIFVFILGGCSSINQIFNSKNIEKNVRLEIVTDETFSKYKKESCSCDLYFENTIRISKKIDENVSFIRDYHSQDFFTIGRLKNSTRVDIWISYCHDVKILEEFWNNGNLIWIKKFDSSGKIIETIHIGHEAENF